MKLLFLDVDGVLNCHEPLEDGVGSGTMHKDKVRRLNRLLRATGAWFVVSSSWRYFVLRGEMTPKGLSWLFRTHGVLDRCAGITGPDVETSNPIARERGRQISEVLHNSVGRFGVRCTDYVVLDDLDLGIRDEGHPLVLVEGTIGLTEADTDQAIAILNKGRA